MSNTLLSILIPTVYGREDSFNRLLGELKKQCDRELVQIISLKDDKVMTIGTKRNTLYDAADGIYSLQIDDDDAIAPNAVALILEAIENGPDCITYKERCTMDGNVFTSNHSLKYDDWADSQDGYDFVRTPFFKDVIKTEIARSVVVPAIRYGEDHAWARLLKPSLKAEVHIDEFIYYYEHVSSDYTTRYGFDRA